MDTTEIICGKEALELLNCVVDSNYDQHKCLSLLHSLRQCVLDKKVKKFRLPDQKQPEAGPGNTKQN